MKENAGFSPQSQAPLKPIQSVQDLMEMLGAARQKAIQEALTETLSSCREIQSPDNWTVADRQFLVLCGIKP